MSQAVTTARSVGSATCVGPDPTKLYTHLGQSKAVHEETLASSGLVWSRALRSWVPGRDLAGAWRGSLGRWWDYEGRLAARSRELSQLTRLSDPWALPLVFQEAFLPPTPRLSQTCQQAFWNCIRHSGRVLGD